MTAARASVALTPAHLPRRRVVLLGASNLTFGLPAALDTARRIWGAPLDVLAALGHGRSYGRWHRLIFRDLPGIIECGLWDALARCGPAPTAALLTDVGNDLLFEETPAQIAAWIEACIDRLLAAGARVALTPLPLCSVAQLSPRKFRLLRTVLFPGSRLQYATAVQRAHELDERLRGLARDRGLQLAEHRPEWYGFDPIHIRGRHHARAWYDMMACWVDAPPRFAPVGGSLRRKVYLALLAPDRRWLFGQEYRKVQPAGRLEDGTTVALY